MIEELGDVEIDTTQILRDRSRHRVLGLRKIPRHRDCDGDQRNGNWRGHQEE